MIWKTRVTELLGITYPIIQGGLAYLAYADLAAAVSNAGGLGQITAMSLESPERLREEIRKVKEKTDRPFGVNFAIGQHGRPFQHMLEAALEEGVPVVSVTGGNPAPFFEQLKGTNVKKLVLVAAVRQAVKAEELGADAVMVVGQEGGGHLGKYDTGTFVLIPKVVDSVSIPVIASGGIGDGRGLMAALALGAEGIEMGTRFIATKECVHAHPIYKEMLVKGSEHDTVVIKRTLGAPGRAIANEWTQKILEIEDKGGTYEQLKEYISGEANRRFIYEGKINEGFAWAGQVMGLIKDVPTVAELFARMIGEAEQIRRRWAN
ncbi:nitronate monooxygenase [Parageobacillus sp. VR-IP]|jgi:NADH:quinone reductase (non-electrogenic)|uniref:Probable nitronate monooxygenase n=2 Tax=Saccharococcus caldoxylosilyticus TaxID=81408 RepID=A0A023DCC2_9BACL|nr:MULTISPECIES: nitronate monooxygenase family protein [Parageobacillus]OQP01775.1 2-nitropropane dioxygenase [Geobacillus sp. 44B]KYD07311.1 Enoyl-[acyl-carrier-protein] reductase [Parageobacillus caldoxylosilyticus]MBB3851713.1 NAD(P)H-dependent flavin oxidoreductase YrpB (nitropropane dioxygenase family) [Parageobacillus caldoxylosilyticus]NUK28972.1 nitronate monooxygenase [Parageobacillus sp. VR-IP]QNU37913.1 nitronate monooxygenase [Geobacillus sp. 44B]